MLWLVNAESDSFNDAERDWLGERDALTLCERCTDAMLALTDVERHCDSDLLNERDLLCDLLLLIEMDCDLLSESDFHVLCDSLLERLMDCEREASLDIPLIERLRLIESDCEALCDIERCSLIRLMLCDLLCEADISMLRERDWLADRRSLAFDMLSDFDWLALWLRLFDCESEAAILRRLMDFSFDTLPDREIDCDIEREADFEREPDLL